MDGRALDEMKDAFNPYRHLVSEYVRLMREGKSYPLGKFSAPASPDLTSSAPRVLIFSPHPDDECIIGALPLRLLREARLNVINVAVTHGSKKERQAERLRELQAACRHLGFSLLTTAGNGLEQVNPQSRAQDPEDWKKSVAVIARMLEANQPKIIFVPHERDWNQTHIGTHLLVLDALKSLPAEFSCYVVETEFWGAMDTPNLMVESSESDVTDMVTATACHAGEVRRNPYHLRLPPWLLDNVRRGGELVGGQGAAAPDFVFATLYRVSRWQQGRLDPAFEGGRQLSCQMNPTELFP